MRGLLAPLALAPLLAATALAGDDVVDYLEVEGPVTPVMASYVERGIEEAAKDGAGLILLRLDTPGGDVALTKRISQAMEQSSVPICVWVAPKGAWAASAGTFLVLSGHKAAMAPGTSIGAASPIDSSGEDLRKTIETKAKNVLVTSIRGLAQRRGERAERWAEDAVRDAVAATPEEALKLGVIDFVAADRETLLRQLDGLAVELPHRDYRNLRTAGATVREIPMTTLEAFLHTITNPTIAFALLAFGGMGVMIELWSPGGILPGVAGGICLLFGCYAVGVLPVNYAGLLLIGLAFLLFILEVKVQTHGALTLGGVAALAVGGLILFNSPLYAVSRNVVFAVAGTIGAFFAFAVSAAVRTRLRPVTTGREGMVGARGVVRSGLAPVGMVFVEGELWRARAEGGEIAPGAAVEVVSMEGMELRVRPA